MTLRLATAADAAAIADLGRRAFIAKFGHLYSAENLAAFLDDAHTAAKVSGELANPDMKVAVIEEDGRLASFCKIVRTSGLPRHTAAKKPMELKQLYTDPDLIGRGHGARLMDWALAEARAWGADEIQLSVYADNPQAQKFYRRYGLEKVADIEFWVGDHCDPEFMFAGPLQLPAEARNPGPMCR
ncbi:GCN5-related N-acetyltransferase [Novosphingobium aromaticivorans DSM 12444]|uniref:GCN5-related N-acetyltransferase n=1 Tax=Novosphingobium aromaticivorans (strain ATCC 700278 / DSM 12444 / CCUG 56034 / CIP 105152 / NBRC 16084 / F199) TaxID=279238 RepID=Q2GBA9_NOVAD|nr:GNAT family N-acetyltransferase [Novosphingobium aromaticivorans]ABD24864.1 GCN5-related N-acetyltransferase [Novosphingobium aromaticivorans DSM 12444]SCY15235.1 Ribosomal protein S18 acetylase RimI [Novosphingobium aromaticivorans]